MNGQTSSKILMQGKSHHHHHFVVDWALDVHNQEPIGLVERSVVVAAFLFLSYCNQMSSFSQQKLLWCDNNIVCTVKGIDIELCMNFWRQSLGLTVPISNRWSQTRLAKDLFLTLAQMPGTVCPKHPAVLIFLPCSELPTKHMFKGCF